MSLETRLKPLVEAIQNKKKVTFFNGAGISTSCGIPDFRSPETGLYANLAKLNLPFAEAVFDIDYFKKNPKPFYTLAEELYPGNYQPSKFHYLIRLIQDKQLLKRVYTQNIDTLERLAGVRDEYIVEAHGSFAKNHCIECHKEMDMEALKSHMRTGIPTCHCSGYVKPDIVFFGEGLPNRFFDMWDEDCDDVEIAIIAGSSLTVFPFASLPSEVNSKCLRILINREIVGDFKKGRKSDILAIDDCDIVAETIADLLGWSKELNELYETEKKKFGKHETKEEKAVEIKDKLQQELTKESAKLNDENELENLIDKLKI
ncbi:unnamed protein product [Candida verbasci]|uniref:NAD-dependent protein deacetylase n=1 Tax=Candida verbasci TaxID=1227364 RepID=A0A9W4TS39_9ASCO|nr:unnamed protein product [Candida verbasci]